MKLFTMEEETIRSLQTFTTVEEMNDMVKWYKRRYQLHKRDRDMLDAISRYACKYTGVCYLSKQKLAEDVGYKTRRTAIRACNDLEALGIIKQYETRRISGDKRRSTNIIVIQNEVVFKCNQIEPKKVSTYKKQSKDTAYYSDKNSSNTHLDGSYSPQFIEMSHPNVTIACHDKKAFYKPPYKTNTYKETYKETELLFKNALKHSIPTPFYEVFSPFFDSETLYEIYGVLLRAKAHLNPPFMLEDYADRYIEHFYNVIRLYKWGKVKNLANYLYVTWERLTSEICRQIRTCSV